MAYHPWGIYRPLESDMNNATPNASVMQLECNPDMSLRDPDPDIFFQLDDDNESGLSKFVFDSPDTDDVLTLHVGTLGDGYDSWEFATVEADWRCPTWDEMKCVKDHLWEAEDVCILR